MKGFLREERIMKYDDFRREMFYLENKLKTRDVANKLGVNQKTIRQWIKHFSLSCESNNSGHYMIDKKNLEYLVYIHEQLKAGKKLADIRLPGKERKVSSDKLDERFSRLLLQIDQLDRKIQSKAGEVVEYQMLQHRKEIDELNDSLAQFNHRLKMVEEKLNRQAEKVVAMEPRKTSEKGKKKRRFASIFSI